MSRRLLAGVLTAGLIAGFMLIRPGSADSDEQDFSVPHSCWSLGGGYEYRTTEQGASLTVAGTEVDISTGQVSASEPLGGDQAAQLVAIAAREARGWDSEHVILLLALDHPDPVTKARIRGEYGDDISDDAIIEKLVVARTALLDSPDCRP